MRNILQWVPINEVLKPPEDFLGHSYDYGLVGPAATQKVATCEVPCDVRAERRGAGMAPQRTRQRYLPWATS